MTTQPKHQENEMKRETKTEKFQKYTHEINSAKSRLLRIMSEMERDGINRKAESLGNLIARLEEWQNSGA